MNNWQTASDEVIKNLPYHVAEWLLEFGSLTEKLEATIGHKVKLEVLNESINDANEKEASLLGINLNDKIWTREVLLFGNENPWIYAKTIVPNSSAFLIESLGKKPLGSILFSEKKLNRQMLAVRELESNHYLHQAASQYYKHNLEQLWGRRSLWQNPEQTEMELLVSEVFLPDSPLYKR